MLGNNPKNYKDINISLNSLKDETKSFNSISEISNINLIELNMQNIEQENYIYYTITNKFKKGINFMVILNEDHNSKVNIVINDNIKFERIKNKILENFIESNEKYKNTNNLKIINLIKKINKKEIKINSEEAFYKNIKDGDILYCDLKGDENWIKINVKLVINDEIKNISFNIKCEKDYLFCNLHYKILKCIFKVIGNLIKNTSKRKYHFVLIDLNCKINNSFLNQVFDFKVSNIENDNLMKTHIGKLLKGNNEIEYELYLNMVENYLIKYFNSKKQNESNLSDRWLYFSEVKNILDYENQKKFGPEFIYIKKYINQYFDTLYKKEGRINSKISKFYFEKINQNNILLYNNEENTIFEISFENNNIKKTDENTNNNSLTSWNILSDNDFSENEEENFSVRNITKIYNLCEEFDNLIDEVDFTNFLSENIKLKLNCNLFDSEEYEKYINLSFSDNINSLIDTKIINNLDYTNDEQKLLTEFKNIYSFLIFFTIIFLIISIIIIYLLSDILDNKNEKNN